MSWDLLTSASRTFLVLFVAAAAWAVPHVGFAQAFVPPINANVNEVSGAETLTRSLGESMEMENSLKRARIFHQKRAEAFDAAGEERHRYAENWEATHAATQKLSSAATQHQQWRSTQHGKMRTMRTENSKREIVQRLVWPDLLCQSHFAADRDRIQSLVHSTLTSFDDPQLKATRIMAACSDMKSQLKAHIHEVRPGEYVNAITFINDIMEIAVSEVPKLRTLAED